VPSDATSTMSSRVRRAFSQRGGLVVAEHQNVEHPPVGD
jgi:hypothetical protein